MPNHRQGNETHTDQAGDPGRESARKDGMHEGEDHKLNLPEPSLKYDPTRRHHHSEGQGQGG